MPNIMSDLNKTKVLLLNINEINCDTSIVTIMKGFYLVNIKTTNFTELSLASNRLELLEPRVLYNLRKPLQIRSTAEN